MAVSRREANKIKCRQDILKASRRLFKEKGYDNTMIEDVAEKADISKATLYNYFPNKESLLVGTMDDQIEATRRYIRDAECTKDDIASGSADMAPSTNSETTSYDKIKLALEFLVLDSRQFIDVSRRILYLNACETSPMFGKVNEVKEMFRELTDKAKDEGVFKNDIHSIEIVELLMSIYLNSQFQWKDIEELTEEQCRQRIERMLEITLSGCFKHQ